jgi:hypothetical protein
MPFPIHPHMLRHACGFALANAGHDTRALQAWLGHLWSLRLRGRSPKTRRSTASLWCAMGRVSPTSSACIVASTIAWRSCTPSTCLSSTASTCGHWHWPSVRTGCANSSKVALPASSSTTTSRATALRSSPTPANSASRASSARTAHVHIDPARARPGLRSRIFRHRACFASRIAMRRRDPEWLRRQMARLVWRIPKKPPAPLCGARSCASGRPNYYAWSVDRIAAGLMKWAGRKAVARRGRTAPDRPSPSTPKI